MKKLKVVPLLIIFAAFGLASVRADNDNSSPTKVSGKPKATAGGVEYWDIVVGTGAKAALGKTVTVHYTGWLTNGKKFDSSVDRDKPYTFQLGGGRVIKGWDEGIPGMLVGGKRQLRVPSDMGYGDRGNSLVPPRATLIFDVELLDVK